jgi:hypothetical protein
VGEESHMAIGQANVLIISLAEITEVRVTLDVRSECERGVENVEKGYVCKGGNARDLLSLRRLPRFTVPKPKIPAIFSSMLDDHGLRKDVWT